MQNSMKDNLTFSEIVEGALHGRRVEPKKRMFEGSYGYAVHKYPIKGGITLYDVMLENIQKTNPLLRRLMEVGDGK